MSLTSTALSVIAQTRWMGDVEFIARENDKMGTGDKFHYNFQRGVQNVKVFIGKDVTGGHIPDGTARTVSTDAQGSITITLDSVLRFDFNIAYDQVSELGDELPPIMSENIGLQLSQWRESVILAGLAGAVSDRSSSGAQVTAITGVTATDGSDAGLGIKNCVAALSKRKYGRTEGSLYAFVNSDVFYQARSYQPIASSFFVREEGAVNRNLPQSYPAYDCWIYKNDLFHLNDFTSTSFLAAEKLTLDSKYGIDGTHLLGTFWDKRAFAVGAAEEVHAFVKDDVHINAWALEARTKFGTQAMLPTGIQLLYKNF